jgi:hypothetical protein
MAVLTANQPIVHCLKNIVQQGETDAFNARFAPIFKFPTTLPDGGDDRILGLFSGMNL